MRRVAAVHFLGDRAVFVRGEETITFVAGDGEKVAVTVHGGAILSSASDGARIVTGGDDGNVVATDAKGESSVLVTDAKHRWIDQVAAHPDGTIAWSAGKTAFVRGPRARRSRSSRLRASAGLHSRRRACGSRSRTTAA